MSENNNNNNNNKTMSESKFNSNLKRGLRMLAYHTHIGVKEQFTEQVAYPEGDHTLFKYEYLNHRLDKDQIESNRK
jgi:hypothetical protein